MLMIMRSKHSAFEIQGEKGEQKRKITSILQVTLSKFDLGIGSKLDLGTKEAAGCNL